MNMAVEAQGDSGKKNEWSRAAQRDLASCEDRIMTRRENEKE
jgi:hypothetical protein